MRRLHHHVLRFGAAHVSRCVAHPPLERGAGASDPQRSIGAAPHATRGRCPSRSSESQAASVSRWVKPAVKSMGKAAYLQLLLLFSCQSSKPNWANRKLQGYTMTYLENVCRKCHEGSNEKFLWTSTCPKRKGDIAVRSLSFC